MRELGLFDHDAIEHLNLDQWEISRDKVGDAFSCRVQSFAFQKFPNEFSIFLTKFELTNQKFPNEWLPNRM